MKTTSFPETLQLPIPFQAYVYPNPDNARGTRVSGHGLVTLGFAPRGDGERVALRLDDIEVTLHPIRLPFDIDKDGQLELIDVPAMAFGAEMFDLAASGGSFDPETKDFEINIVVQLRDGLLADAAGAGLRFEVTERGTLDLDNNRIDARALPITFDDGPLKGLTFVNCMPGELPDQCYAALAMGAVVADGSFPASGTAGQAPSKILIAPNTPVRVLWQASAAPKVDITPEIGEVGPTGSQKFPDTARKLRPISRDATYNGATIGGECVQASTFVEIDVCVAGDKLAQNAAFNDPMSFWNAVLPPHTYDRNILISHIMIDSHHSDAVSFLRWRLDHIPVGGGMPTGTVIQAPDHWEPLATVQMLPGNYRFSPKLDGVPFPSADKGRKIYFWLRVAVLP